MVSARSSFDIRRFIREPLQRLWSGIFIRLINRLEIDQFLRHKKWLVNELFLVFAPPDPLLQFSVIKPPPDKKWLRLMKDSLVENFQQNRPFRPLSQNLLLFDLHPQPPTAQERKVYDPLTAKL